MQYQLSEEKRDSLNFGFYVLLLVFMVAIVIGTRFLYVNKIKYDLTVETLTPSGVPTPETTPVVMIEDPDRIYVVRVVNSTGTSGLAAKTVSALKSAGFNLETSVGNGDERVGTKLSFKNEELKKTKLGVKVISDWPGADVQLASQSEDLIIDLGN